MGLPKGKTNNKNGRPAGIPNKISLDLREQIKALIENNFEKLKTDFNTLSPDKRLIILERYLKYCLPPLQSLDITGNESPDPVQRIFICADPETRDLMEGLNNGTRTINILEQGVSFEDIYTFENKKNQSAIVE